MQGLSHRNAIMPHGADLLTSDLFVVDPDRDASREGATTGSDMGSPKAANGSRQGRFRWLSLERAPAAGL